MIMVGAVAAPGIIRAKRACACLGMAGSPARLSAGAAGAAGAGAVDRRASASERLAAPPR